MPNELSPYRNYQPGDKIGRLFDYQYQNALKRMAQQVSQDWDGFEGSGKPDYELREPTWLVRITGKTLLSDGTSQYTFSRVRPQDLDFSGNTSGPLLRDDANVDTEILSDLYAYNLGNCQDVPIDGSVVVEVSPGQAGRYLTFKYDVSDMTIGQVVSVASNGSISWVEIEQGSTGTYANRTFGLSGNETVNWATVLDSNLTVQAGDRGIFKRGHCEGGVRVVVTGTVSGDAASAQHGSQELYVENVVDGTFKLRVEGVDTGEISWNSTTELGTEINTTLGGNASVSVSGNGTHADPWNVTFSDYVARSPFEADIRGLKSTQIWTYIPVTAGVQGIPVKVIGPGYNNTYAWEEVRSTGNGTLETFPGAQTGTITCNPAVDISGYGFDFNLNNYCLAHRSSRTFNSTINLEVYANATATTYQYQSLYLTHASAGTFTLRFNNGTSSATTSGIPWNATAATVQSVLESLPNIGAGNVNVTGYGNIAGPWLLEMKPSFANYTLMTASNYLTASGEWLIESSPLENETLPQKSTSAAISVSINETACVTSWTLVSESNQNGCFPLSGNSTCNPAIVHAGEAIANIVEYRPPASNITLVSSSGLNQTWEFQLSNATAGNFTLLLNRYNSANTNTSLCLARTFPIGVNASYMQSQLTVPGCTSSANVTATISWPNMTYNITLTKVMPNLLVMSSNLSETIGNSILAIDAITDHNTTSRSYRVLKGAPDELQTFEGPKNIGGVLLIEQSETSREAVSSNADYCEYSHGPAELPCENANAPFADSGTTCFVNDYQNKRFVIGSRDWGTTWPSYPFGGIPPENPTSVYSVLRGDGAIVDGETTGANGGAYSANSALGLEFLGGIFKGLQSWLESARTQKGAILISNGTDWTYLTPGADGTVLTANSSQPTGVEWV